MTSPTPYDLARDGDLWEERGTGFLADGIAFCTSKVVKTPEGRLLWSYAKYNHVGLVAVVTETKVRFIRNEWGKVIPDKLIGHKYVVEALLRVTPTPFEQAVGNRFKSRLSRLEGMSDLTAAMVACFALKRLDQDYALLKIPAHFVDWFMGAGSANRFASHWGGEVCSSMAAMCLWQGAGYLVPDVKAPRDQWEQTEAGVLVPPTFDPHGVTPKDLGDAVDAGDRWRVVWESEGPDGTASTDQGQ